ncbi:MAG: hypothetical protein AB1758_29805, partial [Candidatus Eremiobacterota bacterium]
MINAVNWPAPAYNLPLNPIVQPAGWVDPVDSLSLSPAALSELSAGSPFNLDLWEGMLEMQTGPAEETDPLQARLEELGLADNPLAKLLVSALLAVGVPEEQILQMLDGLVAASDPAPAAAGGGAQPAPAGGGQPAGAGAAP